MDESNSPQSDYLLPGRVYDVLKWLALIALPAVAWLVGVVGPQWGLPHCGELVTTINAIGVFVGALIGVSQLAGDARTDGNALPCHVTSMAPLPAHGWGRGLFFVSHTNRIQRPSRFRSSCCKRPQV